MEELKSKFSKSIVMAVVALLIVGFYIAIAVSEEVIIRYWLPELIIGGILLIVSVISAVVAKSDLNNGNYPADTKNKK